ncbi:hypothetical protein TNCV_4502981 [Trichonephila clavipes]|nr:hypothetical protein TNCV_4502981 [Trichonephila clavipes]
MRKVYYGLPWCEVLQHTHRLGCTVVPGREWSCETLSSPLFTCFGTCRLLHLPQIEVNPEGKETYGDHRKSKPRDSRAESHTERTVLQEFPGRIVYVPNSAYPSMEIILKDSKLYLILCNTVFELKTHSLNFLAAGCICINE